MGTKPLRLKSLNQQQLRSTYSVLWDSSDTQQAALNRKGYDNVTLSTIITWADDGDRHLEHLASIKFFLRKGTMGVDAATGRKKKFPAPCGTGINSEYITYVFADHTAELTCGLSVWARVGSNDPFMVNAMVCRDLEDLKGIEDRLYLWMVCGGYPGAFSLGMSTLKTATREKMIDGKRAYKGLCLTASQMALVEVYERQGFQLTPNACSYPTTGRYSRSMAKLYKDRVEHFMCKDGVTCDKGESARWANALVDIGVNHPRAELPPLLQGNPKKLTKDQRKERRKLELQFWDDTMNAFAPEWEEVPTGDGIFMDMCFSV